MAGTRNTSTETEAVAVFHDVHRGGLVLWVRTRDAECEQKALDILRRHSGHDVHLHQLPERAGRESDVPHERPRVVHLLDWNIRF